MKLNHGLTPLPIALVTALIVPGASLAIGSCEHSKAAIDGPPEVPLTSEGPRPSAPTLVVRFSPGGGCTDMLVAWIDQAKVSVRMQAYSFTSRPIEEALIRAHDSRVDVQIIVDPTAQYGAVAQTLVARGIPVLVDAAHALAHNKVLIVDGLSFETGSFNFTKAAEGSNAENCLFVSNAGELAASYAANWQVHKGHSSALTPTPSPVPGEAAPGGQSDREQERLNDYLERLTPSLDLPPNRMLMLPAPITPVIAFPRPWPPF